MVVIVGCVVYFLCIDLFECGIVYLLVGCVVCDGWCVEDFDEVCVIFLYFMCGLVVIVDVYVVLLVYVILCVDFVFEVGFVNCVYVGDCMVVDVWVG